MSEDCANSQTDGRAASTSTFATTPGHVEQPSDAFQRDDRDSEESVNIGLRRRKCPLCEKVLERLEDSDIVEHIIKDAVHQHLWGSLISNEQRKLLGKLLKELWRMSGESCNLCCAVFKQSASSASKQSMVRSNVTCEISCDDCMFSHMLSCHQPILVDVVKYASSLPAARQAPTSTMATTSTSSGDPSSSSRASVPFTTGASSFTSSTPITTPHKQHSSPSLSSPSSQTTELKPVLPAQSTAEKHCPLCNSKFKPETVPSHVVTTDLMKALQHIGTRQTVRIATFNVKNMTYAAPPSVEGGAQSQQQEQKSELWREKLFYIALTIHDSKAHIVALQEFKRLEVAEQICGQLNTWTVRERPDYIWKCQASENLEKPNSTRQRTELAAFLWKERNPARPVEGLRFLKATSKEEIFWDLPDVRPMMPDRLTDSFFRLKPEMVEAMAVVGKKDKRSFGRSPFYGLFSCNGRRLLLINCHLTALTLVGAAGNAAQLKWELSHLSSLVEAAFTGDVPTASYREDMAVVVLGDFNADPSCKPPSNKRWAITWDKAKNCGSYGSLEPQLPDWMKTNTSDTKQYDGIYVLKSGRPNIEGIKGTAQRVERPPKSEAFFGYFLTKKSALDCNANYTDHRLVSAAMNFLTPPIDAVANATMTGNATTPCYEERAGRASDEESGAASTTGNVDEAGRASDEESGDGATSGNVDEAGPTSDEESGDGATSGNVDEAGPTSDEEIGDGATSGNVDEAGPTSDEESGDGATSGNVDEAGPTSDEESGDGSTFALGRGLSTRHGRGRGPNPVGGRGGGLNLEGGRGRGRNLEGGRGRGRNLEGGRGRGRNLEGGRGRGRNPEGGRGRGRNPEGGRGRGRNPEGGRGRGPNLDGGRGRGPNLDGGRGRGPNLDGGRGRGPNLDGGRGRGPNSALANSGMGDPAIT
ncbi:hypothetical protein Agub_g6489 [Astrephomene gubernaculifera]|uniref:Endonuclease/exonuclease/phosphatase domain-containing protein n=1 Tax=Astrephomene gubernaculifera TaxID=47775 RepID=A0AAD3HLL6_9CHLO|nr:hypothetical protein Agub_g6489 [Astrephomene gubernaculifera]